MVEIYYDHTKSEDYSYSEIQQFVEKLNAICEVINKGGYAPGTRNNIAVDLCCVCYVLGLDPMEVAVSVFPEPDDPDLDDLEERVDVIAPYLEYWNSGADIEQYMLCCWGKPGKEWFTLI